MKLKHCFASPAVCHVVSIPKYIAWYMRNVVWEGSKIEDKQLIQGITSFIPAVCLDDIDSEEEVQGDCVQLKKNIQEDVIFK